MAAEPADIPKVAKKYAARFQEMNGIGIPYSGGAFNKAISRLEHNNKTVAAQMDILEWNLSQLNGIDSTFDRFRKAGQTLGLRLDGRIRLAELVAANPDAYREVLAEGRSCGLWPFWPSRFTATTKTPKANE